MTKTRAETTLLGCKSGHGASFPVRASTVPVKRRCVSIQHRVSSVASQRDCRRGRHTAHTPRRSPNKEERPRLDRAVIRQHCRIPRRCLLLRCRQHCHAAELGVLPRDYPYGRGHRVAAMGHRRVGPILFYDGDGANGSNDCGHRTLPIRAASLVQRRTHDLRRIGAGAAVVGSGPCARIDILDRVWVPDTRRGKSFDLAAWRGIPPVFAQDKKADSVRVLMSCR